MNKFKKALKILYKIIIIFIIFVAICYTFLYLYAKLSSTLEIKSANSYYLYDNELNLFSSSNDDWVSIDNISKHLLNATVSIEDKNFYNHTGFDFLRIAKAFIINLVNMKTLQGASTITQQYAKNLFLDFDKKWSRKAEEAILTLRLETHYSKNEILEGYVNTINYGGIFGIENASQYYFNKKAADLTLAEATILAGIPKSPSNYSPLVDEKAAKKRQKLILNSMVENNYITKVEADEAYNTKLTYIGASSTTEISSLMYYRDAVLEELKTIKSIPSSFLKTGGLKIYTTLDIKAQQILEKNMEEKLQNNDEIQIASVALDPENGDILAIIGGRDYYKSVYNRVTDSKRQVGSTIKPLLYYTALKNGFTASTTFTSEKTTFTFDDNKKYSPKNYGDSYGNIGISMGTAIAYSDNIYAVKTHIFLGEENLVNFLKEVGAESNLEAIPSLALGTEEMNILEMMKAYASLASGGYDITPHFIDKVEDINGNILYQYKNTKTQILDESIVFILNNLLTSSYSTDFIDYNYPTCISIANKITKKYAIKTGTTNTDHLIFGYNKDLLLGIWMGYDDNRESEVSDGTIMKNIWVDTMEEYLKNYDTSWYKAPSNVIGVLVNPITGKLATKEDTKKTIFYYLKGTQPLSK